MIRHASERATIGENAVRVRGADRGSLRRVLLVDDAPDIRLLARLALDSSDGYVVVAEAATGVEAIELAAHHQPDVVLLDVSLPGMDGLQALPQILRVSPGSRVLMFSAFYTRALAETALRLGAVATSTRVSSCRNWPNTSPGRWTISRRASPSWER